MANLTECETANRPYLLGRPLEGGLTILYRPDCQLWSCPHCANVKAKQWAARARIAIRDKIEADWHFLTLTVETRSANLDHQIEIWSSAWDKFSKRLRRAVERKITYMAIPELSPQKKRLHAHIILDWNCYSEERMRFYSRTKNQDEHWKYYSPWLHEHCKASGLGYIYDIQPLLEPALAASYIAKYIGKGLSEVFPKGFRRVRTSQAFPEIEAQDIETQYDWTVLPCSEAGRGILLLALLSGEIIQEVATQNKVTIRHPLITETNKAPGYMVLGDD